MFAKTAVVALLIIILAYISFVFTVFVKSPFDIPIPKDNSYAYLVLSNVSDPESPKIPNFNQSLSAPYTGFRFATSNFPLLYFLASPPSSGISLLTTRLITLPERLPILRSCSRLSFPG
jgi:hypothetical protein